MKIYYLTGVLILVFILRFSLTLIPEPLRLQIWTLLQTYMPLLGGAGMLIGVVYALQMKTWKRLDVCITLVVSGLCVFFPLAQFLTGETYPSDLNATPGALYVRLPLNEKVVIAWGGDDIKTNYHAAYPAQRWAYDLVISPHSLGSKNLLDYGCFGKDILAPVSGEIRTAHDGANDRIPDEDAADIQGAFGNYIVIKPNGTDDRLVIAHLKKGSILVKRGDSVAEGVPIAQCGNSGNSTEPHVHIHYVKLHQHDNEILMTGLPLYFRNHNGPPMPIGGFKKIKGRIVAVGSVVRHTSELDSKIFSETALEE
jgi:hypothetical protein